MSKRKKIDFHEISTIVYIIICVFDFLLFPFFYEWRNSELTPDKQVQLAMEFKDGGAQVQAFIALRQEKVWQPITLQQNGLFHIAFGTILGVGIWARNKQGDLRDQLQHMSNNLNSSLTISNTTTTTNSITPS